MATAATETKHTLGPWYVTECDDFIRVRQESSDAVLATMEDGTHPELELIPWAEQQANAALIAAAPCLLNELEVCASGLFMLRKAIEAGDPKAELLIRVEDMLRDAKAAIGKARS